MNSEELNLVKVSNPLEIYEILDHRMINNYPKDKERARIKGYTFTVIDYSHAWKIKQFETPRHKP